MLGSIINFVKDHTYISIVIGALIFLFLYWLFFVDKSGKGTWNKTFHFPEKEPIGQRIRASGESKGEAECRYVLETIFNKPFKKRRPKFLFNNKTGSNMELDMYNKELGIACEYNGKQHYEYVPYFHRGGESDFIAQRERDNLKRRVCRKLGIFLIEIPYTVKLENIRQTINGELRKNGFKV